MLNGFTADAIGKPVVAGPIEATCIGNILSQMTTSGEFESLKKARQSLVESFCVKRFEPSNGSVWQEARREFRDLVLQSV